MINITINDNGSTSQEVISLGSQFENIDEVIQFTFPSDLEGLHKYVVAKTYDEKKKKNITRVTPLVDNKFVIGSAITKVTGQWLLYTLCKAYSPDGDVERVSISDPIVATVTENDFDISEIEATEIDPNIKIIYDELIDFKKTLEANEATRQGNETSRVNAENGRVSNETARANAEQARQENEAQRAENETNRASAETARASAEVERAKAETARANAEATRKEAEDKRISDEAVRTTNESARVTSEANRTQSEAQRVQSETDRQANEETRSDAEKTRVQSEQERTTAETSRVSAETTRQNNENERVNAETNRATAESERAEAETTRLNNEQSRVDAEKLRVSAEQARVTAETARAEAEAKRDGTITKLREDVDANTKADGVTQRSLKALWDLNKGISYKFEDDIQRAYQKTVPTGAKLGSVINISGRTIVYNQYFTELSETGNYGVVATYADNVITLNGTAIQNWFNLSQMTEKMNVVGKFYVKMTILKNDDNVNLYYSWLNRKRFFNAFSKGSQSAIANQTEDDLKLGLSTGFSGFDVDTVFNDVKLQIIIVNLTQMFGSGNEPTTVEEFEAIFPNDYYPYNEGTLMNMSVNEVDVVGKNIFKCKNFSCSGLGGIYRPSLSNSYGTSINSTEPSNGVTVTQSKIADEINVASYINGYFCVSFKPFIANTNYVFSFDLTPSNKLLSVQKLFALINGNSNEGNSYSNNQELQIGKKSKIYFSFEASNKEVKYVEIRNCGISGVFENFQIEKGTTNTSYSPYAENLYPIPQAILNLEGYGWGVNNAYNYVDYENKKFIKNVGRVDLSTLQFVYTAYGDNNDLYGFRSSLPQGIKKDDSAFSKTNNLLCSKYPDTPWKDACKGTDKTISQLSQSIQINDSSFTDIEAFNNSLKGEYLYYELATPIVTDISDIIDDTFQEPFEVEQGGSLTFKNVNGDGYQLAVPSNVQYIIKLNEVTS